MDEPYTVHHTNTRASSGELMSARTCRQLAALLRMRSRQQRRRRHLDSINLLRRSSDHPPRHPTNRSVRPSAAPLASRFIARHVNKIISSSRRRSQPTDVLRTTSRQLRADSVTSN